MTAGDPLAEGSGKHSFPVGAIVRLIDLLEVTAVRLSGLTLQAGSGALDVATLRQTRDTAILMLASSASKDRSALSEFRRLADVLEQLLLARQPATSDSTVPAAASEPSPTPAPANAEPVATPGPERPAGEDDEANLSWLEQHWYRYLPNISARWTELDPRRRKEAPASSTEWITLLQNELEEKGACARSELIEFARRLRATHADAQKNPAKANRPPSPF